ILIAMIAMLFTGFSYGKMASAYPSAGSAYTYVGQEIHPALGYLAGWGMLLDYTLLPIICTIWCAEQSHAFVPGVPVSLWKIVYAVAFTLCNLQSIRASARINVLLASSMSAVVIVVFIAAAHYIGEHPHSDPTLFSRPFYDPDTFTYGNLIGSTSVAVL